jgi:hypothetical protein
VTLLTAGQQKITADPRITLLGYNLQVRDIRYTDQGDYTCQIGDGSHGDLIHTVEILMPPSIQIYPNSGDVLTTRKGAPVSFECRANGNPSPIVQWSKKEGLLPSGLQVQTGYLLSLSNVQRQDAGVYQCTASNGIGQPVTGEVQLHVLCKGLAEMSQAKSLCFCSRSSGDKRGEVLGQLRGRSGGKVGLYCSRRSTRRSQYFSVNPVAFGPRINLQS